MLTKVQNTDFSHLTLCDALDLATLIEEEAMERYGELADQLEKHRTPAAAQFFRMMQRTEEKHRTKLAERRKRLFGIQPMRLTREMVFDVEAPEYEKARMFMSVREALDAAMASEIKARDFFEEALLHVRASDVHDLFAELRDEEIEHQALIQKQIDALGATQPEDPNDYADDPVGQ